MEVDEKPTENYTDIGGLDKQIEELVEAIVLPMQQAEKFKSLGIKAPKGALMYGPPGSYLVFLYPVLSEADLGVKRNRKDVVGSCLRRSDERMLPQTCWTFSCSGAAPFSLVLERGNLS